MNQCLSSKHRVHSTVKYSHNSALICIQRCLCTIPMYRHNQRQPHWCVVEWKNAHACAFRVGHFLPYPLHSFVHSLIHSFCLSCLLVFTHSFYSRTHSSLIHTLRIIIFLSDFQNWPEGVSGITHLNGMMFRRNFNSLVSSHSCISQPTYPTLQLSNFVHPLLLVTLWRFLADFIFCLSYCFGMNWETSLSNFPVSS